MHFETMSNAQCLTELLLTFSFLKISLFGGGGGGGELKAEALFYEVF